jgi:hypothetical protein
MVSMETARRMLEKYEEGAVQVACWPARAPLEAESTSLQHSLPERSDH